MNDRRRRFLQGLLSAALLGLATPMQAKTDAITIQRKAGGIIIPVRVNGVLTSAILDNASERTLVSPELALKAKLVMVKERGSVTSWGATKQAELASSTPLKIGEVNAQVEPIVLPFGAAGPPEPVLLGADALQATILDLDFSGERLKLMRRASFKVPSLFTQLSSAASSVPAPHRGAPANIPLMLEGHKIVASLDLGSAAALHVSKPFAERYHLLEGRKVSAALSGSVGGLTSSPTMTLGEVSFGGHHFTGVPVEMFDAPTKQR